jgi:hypothetical protein
MFTQVNLRTGQTFIPDLPEGIFRAESFEVGSSRPLRVLSLGQTSHPVPRFVLVVLTSLQMAVACEASLP